MKRTHKTLSAWTRDATDHGCVVKMPYGEAGPRDKNLASHLAKKDGKTVGTFSEGQRGVMADTLDELL